MSSISFENFIDGKVKGKSKPGRVKRSGASCNGSVTSLRKKAKSASGEKAKMYHWCANMKSGRNKTNEEMMTTADAGIPRDTKNMGPRLKTYNVTDRRRRKDKPPVLLKRFRKYHEDLSNEQK